MNVRALAFVLSVALPPILCGCGAVASLPQSMLAPAATGVLPSKAPSPRVYWTLYAGVSYPQVQFARVPLTKKSRATNVGASSRNDLVYTSGMAVDSAGRLWILSFGSSHGNPTSALVFTLPLKDASVPLYTFVLSKTSGADALTFDPAGNLWVTSPGNHDIMKYTGPFKKSRTLKPAVTLEGGPLTSYYITFDKKSNHYVSIANSTGTNSIGVAKPPYARKDTYFLNGLSSPGGLIFDKAGNLYAAGKVASGNPAVVRYDSDDLKSGDTPSIIDSTGLPGESYEAAFAFTPNGDLYAANCGNNGSAGIDVYPTSTKHFSSVLAPSVEYTNADITGAGCAWGIAIR